ncbi:LamG domain-containing protein [Streptomyces microflavus]|uniref:LamG domain-containing protein n=1 Tax=Streptomyces TaxID=1883 RepID=UPI0027959A7B|nr:MULTISPECIES: LamG domain-containing protein [Streptomyces]
MTVALAVAASVVAPVSSGWAETGLSDDRSALEEAAESGRPVEVLAERTEYTQTMANPDGTLTLTQSTEPQRVRGANGSWRDTDATLERRQDGSVGPKGAVVDLRFSGGGAGEDLVRLGGQRGAMTLAWPGPLPKPVLEGATATYPEVLKGVDLQLTATLEGYRQVLVVKSAEAAANPALSEITMGARGEGLRIQPGSGGGISAVDEDGNVAFSGPVGQMWDSAGDDVTTVRASRTAFSTRSGSPAAESGEGPMGADESARPSKGDASALLPVKVGSGAITVEPDLDVLRGKDTVYPVYIDPPIGAEHSERSVLSSDGDRFWQFSGDYGVGRCSTAGPYYCTTGASYTNRMFFEFAPTKLTGKHVLDATFRAYETWSFDCTPHWVDLKRTDNISKATKWPGPAVLDHMGDRNVSAGRSTNCSPSQPDAWVEFSDNADETDENLTSTVRSFAEGKFSRFTLSLRAKDEGDASAWKRFDDNAELQVIYVPKPGVPTSVGVIPGDGTQQYCSKSATAPTTVTRLDPMLQGALQTQVQPKSGEFTGSLRAYFHVEQQNGSTWATAWTAMSPASGFRPDGHVERVRISSRADGTLYRMKALTQSYWTLNKVTSKVSSGYSPWCYFKIDATSPKAPQITSTGVYTSCTATLCEGKGGPGRAGQFKLTPNAADKDIIGYRWRLLSDKGAKEATGSSVTVAPVPALSGTQVLTVEARDVRSRWGAPAEFVFKVAPAAGPVGRWHFADGVPGSAVKTAADSATEGLRHDATLYPQAGNTSATWSVMGRRGTDDYSLSLNDDTSDPAKQVGYASTATPPLNTKESFTISTWALLTDASQTRVVASAPGAYGSAFHIYYSPDARRWVFNRAVADVQSPVYVRSYGSTVDPPMEVWTHLAGVFDTKGDSDKTNDTIQLFVNGRAQGAPVGLHSTNASYTPAASTGGMYFGRSKIGQYFSGRVDEVTVWQRPLTSDEVREDSALRQDGVPATELVGYWDTAGATDGKVPEWTWYASVDMDISATGATADAENNELRLDGVSGGISTYGPAVDETGSFTVTADVKLDAALFAAKPVGYRAQVFGQQTPSAGESSWALWVEKVSQDGYLWRFGRTATDATGKVIETGSVPSGASAEMDTWVQITGVYDATESTEEGFGETHLYVNEAEQAREEKSAFTTPMQGSGDLAAGRGSAGGKTGHHLPGALDEMRIWTGAMTADQVSIKALGNPGEE